MHEEVGGQLGHDAGVGVDGGADRAVALPLHVHDGHAQGGDLPAQLGLEMKPMIPSMWPFLSQLGSFMNSARS